MPNYTDNLTPAEREIVRYLLGDALEQEASRIGEKSVVDPDYAELIDAVELDLMEAYICNRLSPSERALFDSNFLLTTERKDTLLALQIILDGYRKRRQDKTSNG